MKRTSVTRTAYYHVTLVLVQLHSFLCICTILILIQPKIYDVFHVSVGIHFNRTCQTVLELFTNLRIFPRNFCSISMLKTQQICLILFFFCLILSILNFFSDMKRFNIRYRRRFLMCCASYSNKTLYSIQDAKNYVLNIY